MKTDARKLKDMTQERDNAIRLIDSLHTKTRRLEKERLRLTHQLEKARAEIADLVTTTQPNYL